MLKRTLYISQPASLRLELLQLKMLLTDEHGEEKEHSFPIEDLGMIILDHPQIRLTHALIMELMKQNVILVSCATNHMPSALMLPYDTHTLIQERFTTQIEASEPLKKQLWSQLVKQKILNQASVLSFLGFHDKAKLLSKFASEVKSGDTTNREGIASSQYWPTLFHMLQSFQRDPDGAPPNNYLNYTYAILRAATARSLIEVGLLPMVGLHHHHRSNAFCLADDLMEPYRPFVDLHVYQLIQTHGLQENLTREIKAQLLRILYVDCEIKKETRPLLNALLISAQSLQKCLAGENKKLQLPNLSSYGKSQIK